MRLKIRICQGSSNIFHTTEALRGNQNRCYSTQSTLQKLCEPASKLWRANSPQSYSSETIPTPNTFQSFPSKHEMVIVMMWFYYQVGHKVYSTHIQQIVKTIRNGCACEGRSSRRYLTKQHNLLNYYFLKLKKAKIRLNCDLCRSDQATCQLILILVLLHCVLPVILLE